MNIVVVFDGSDDALAGLALAAGMFGESKVRHRITVTIVGWPPRLSPIWDKAFEARAALDDLHRAMAEVAARELKRLHDVFTPLGEVESYFAEGDPATEVKGLVDRERADLVLVGLTRGRHRDAVHGVIGEVMAVVGCPVFVAHGPAVPQR